MKAPPATGASRDTNPLRAGLRRERVPDPCTMVIFGATGDLTRRKLLPALVGLGAKNLLPAGFSVVGVSRSAWSDARFREEMRAAVEEEEAAAGDTQGRDARPARGAEPAASPGAAFGAVPGSEFAAGLRYLQADFARDQDYARLAELLAEVDAARGTAGNRVFYLAVPPSLYPTVIQRLGRAGLDRGAGGGWARIIIEKPFGRDLATARELNEVVSSVFREAQVYRIDHYLGKETVQNLLVFRFANTFLEPTWNRHYIDHVQITVAEEIGIAGRGGYYEEAGVLRDMFQNHLLQLLCLVAMEAPVDFAADSVRDEKVKVLRAVRPIIPDQIDHVAVRAQYQPGARAGRPLPGYREEEGVAPDSATPTFAALRLLVDNWRWEGVPFYLRSGKRMTKKDSEIAVVYREVPHVLFGPEARAELVPNVITLRIQPDEGISLKFEAKLPGLALRMRPVTMDFSYGSSFGLLELPSAYERLLLDCMLGEATLFTRRDEVESAWSLLAPLLEAWDGAGQEGLALYEAGTWGPAEADVLLQKDGRRWRRL